jgi:GTP-binding protein
MHGKSGEDLVLVVPVGSVITNKESGQSVELLRDGETAVILKGGRGGLGNERFKSSTNRNPMESTQGLLGEEADLHIELKLIVDAGFVGLPNAGKSSLLNALTNARAKVADYPFTTLDPNLGDFYGHILADIPGLIEGASAGKGLGHKFLRHISRTKVLVHCVSAEHDDPGAVYRTVKGELAMHDDELARKAEMTVLTKTDLVSPEALSERLRMLKEACGREPLYVTILDDASVKRFSDALTAFLRREGK